MNDWQSEVRARMAPLNLKPEREADIVDEIAQHLAERYREAISAGAAPDEATRLALAEFQAGNALAQRIAALKQAHAPAAVTPGVSTGHLIEDLWQDLRYAARAFCKQPGFAATAVLILALGIGATTAIFSVVYSVLIKPLPYPNADDLVRIRHAAPGINVEDIQASSNMYLTYRQEGRTFAEVGLWQASDATLTIGNEPQRVRALFVSDGTLQALGVQPARGRWFTEADHGVAPEAPAPLILSHSFSQRSFGSDEAALGRELETDAPSGTGTLPWGSLSQVVGIMPRDFSFLDVTPQPDVIIPVRLDPDRQAHGAYRWEMLARLEPGVTVPEAQTDLERMRPIHRDAWPPFPGSTMQGFDGMRISGSVRPLQDDLVGGVSSMLWVLMAAIGAVLLIACANIANLVLVRADARRQELAVRAALGAAPARIARALLADNFVLGAAASVLGLALAYAGVQVLVANGPSNLPRLQEISVYPPVLAFTLIVSLASTLLLGSITALKHARHVDMPAIGAARGSIASREGNRTRNTLVVAQVALAVVLVVSAALMIRTVQALRDVDLGFSDPATIQLARIWIPRAEFEGQFTRMEREIADKIAALPGVTAVGFTDNVPIAWGGMGMRIAAEGRTPTGPLARIKYVSPGYFEAMGTRLIAGRELTWSDVEAGGRVVVVSEPFARELAPEAAGALGKRVRFDGTNQDAWREVVGVVQGIHESGVYEAPISMVYWPVRAENLWGLPASETSSVTFAIRSERAGTASLVEEVRSAVRSVSASIPVGQVRTMQDLHAGSLARTSFTLVLLAIAGAVALVLGIVGIYGVIAYVVAQRTREIGIRSALGADPTELVRMFVRRGLALSAVGAVAGLVAAGVLARLMSSLLFGVSSLDPLAYVGALAATIAAATLASYLPAQRAARIDPMNTLRAD
ncbi:MAG TPA: ABC transporter permease [Gammaproteobacteria bacterium]